MPSKSRKPHFLRHDVKASVVVPEHLTALLLRAGGTNPYGESMYRLILAEDRMTKAAGIWNIWAEDATLDDRCGLGINEAQTILQEAQDTIEKLQLKGCDDDTLRKVEQIAQEEIDALLQHQLGVHPNKVIEGMNDQVPLYCFDGWIVEKWKPAHCFGTPDQWNAYTYGIHPVLGPYPNYGDYSHIAGPSPHLPTEKELIEAIQEHLKALRDRPATPAQRMRQMLATMQQRQRERMRDIKNRAEAFRKDNEASLYNRVSLGAGRVRNELAKRAGIKEHYGN